MKKIKRIMCILISLTMVFNVFTTLPATADADDEENAQISYVDRQWNASTRKVESSTKYVNGDTVTEFTSNLVNLDTWYLVKGSINVTQRLYVQGSATLILADGARLYCKDGINVSKGNTLNIYCQTQETGELYCDADTNDNAAIGADDEAGDCGTINIYGGIITADTDDLGTDGAGIGGGDEGNGGTVSIYGGNVTAIGGKYGAGIGGGDADGPGGNGGTTIIYGGTVNAAGGRHAAGIGGGEEGDGGVVEIWGGVVKAAGGVGAAAIGGGYEGKGGEIKIAGGEVTAIAGEDAAAIGCGYGRSEGSLDLGSMKVVSGDSEGSAALQTADQRQAGCHMSYVKVAFCTEHTFNTTTVIDDAGTHSYHCIYCDFTDEEHTHPHDIKILNWKWADDYSSAMVSVSCDTCGYSDDITASGGQIREEITDAESGERRLTASITINGVEYTDSLIKYKTEYVDLNGDVQQTGYIDKITADTKDLSSGWYLVTADITDSNRIRCNGDINLILCDGVTLDNPAGISVNQGNSLTIWGQTEGTGKLIITSPPIGFAGIGGDRADSGQITINGGTITAKSVASDGSNRFSGAAGIGGGQDGSGKVTINGGTVNATGGSYTYGYKFRPFSRRLDIYIGGAGIGGGARGGSSLIMINGGDVTAHGGRKAAGIGGGGCLISGLIFLSFFENDVLDYLEDDPEYICLDSKHEVIINGGSVKAYGGESGAGIGTGENEYNEEGIVTINGGYITAQSGGYAAAIGGGKRNKGIVTVNGGEITANSGGIGSGWENSPKGSVTLGYGDSGATIYSYEYHNTDITLVKPFTDGTYTYEAKEYGSENEDIFKDKTIYTPKAGVFVGYNLSLGGDIGLIYYLDITDEEAKNNTVEFNWSYIAGGELKSKSYTCEVEKDEEDGLYIAVCPVSAAEMVYGINASITIDGDRYTDNYAVFRFADTILTGEGFAKSYVEFVNSMGKNGEEKLKQLRTLMKAMLDYGSYAQVYFDRAPELLVNSEFVTDDPASPYYYVPEEVTADMIHTRASDMSAGLEAYGLEYAGSTLVYLSKTTLRHYYKITDHAKFDAVKDKVIFDGQNVTYTAKDDLVYFELTDITAPDLDTPFVLKIGDSEYKYSALDYVKECLTSKDTSEDLKNLAKATYRYNKAANIFLEEGVN